MGLYTNSISYRKSLETKNYYSPDNEYDITGNEVSTALDNLQKLGLNPRGNSIVSFGESLVQNTKLDQIARERLTIELGRRAAVNLLNDNLPIVNFSNLFDKNKDTKFLMKQKDWSITPKNKSNSSVSQGIKNTVGNLFGAVNDYSEIFQDKNIRIGSVFYYTHLGEAQKSKLNSLIGYNYYGNFAAVNVNNDNLSRINIFTDNRPVPALGISRTYTSEDFDSTRDFDFFAENKYVKPTDDTSPVGFVETLNSGNAKQNALDIYGFGRTSIEKYSKTDPLQYRENDGNIVWGDETTFPSNINRGLLHYTNNIIKSRTEVGKLIDQTNKSFQVGNTLVYKATKCRSWTVKDQYDELSKAIRHTGNGIANSVLKDSPFPHQYPRKNDTKEDARRYMFSFENLAWKKQDLDDMNVPECERGENGGRIMWFPFYGVTINESMKANFDATNFIGRIEPTYSYTSTERSLSLTFTLIVDYPNVLKNFKGREAAYFANCEGIADGITTTISTSNKTISDAIKQQTDTASKVVINNKATFNKCIYYFDNNIFNIDLNYETTGTNPLNVNFNDDTSNFELTLSSTEANGSQFRIEGYASQLAKTDYNARLGYKRAYQLMQYIIGNTNSINTTSERKVNIVPDKNFVNDSFLEKNVSDVDNLTEVIFKDKARNIQFTLVSKGESTAGIIGEAAANKDLLAAKLDRRSVLLFTGNIQPEIPQNQTILPPTSEDIVNKKANDDQIDTVNSTNTGNDCTPFEELKLNDKLPMDFDKLKYFRPAFHSQTPEDKHKRETFLQQLMRPGSTLKSDSNQQGSNSIFGRMPVSVLRIGDFFHTKVIIHSINIEQFDGGWNLNPDAMVAPMFANVTMDLSIIGGMSLKGPIDRLQNAISFNYYAQSTGYGSDYYSSNQGLTGSTIGPVQSEIQQYSGNKN